MRVIHRAHISSDHHLVLMKCMNIGGRSKTKGRVRSWRTAEVEVENEGKEAWFRPDWGT